MQQQKVLKQENYFIFSILVFMSTPDIDSHACHYQTKKGYGSPHEFVKLKNH